METANEGRVRKIHRFGVWLDGSAQENCSSSCDLFVEGGQDSIQCLLDEVDLIKTGVRRDVFRITVLCDVDPKEVVSVVRRSFEECWDFSFEVIHKLFVAEREQVIHVDRDDYGFELSFDFLSGDEGVGARRDELHTKLLHDVFQA